MTDSGETSVTSVISAIAAIADESSYNAAKAAFANLTDSQKVRVSNATDLNKWEKYFAAKRISYDFSEDWHADALSAIWPSSANTDSGKWGSYDVIVRQRIVNEDGSNTLPSDWTITNKSTIAGIHLSQIDMDAGSTGWKLLAGTENTKELPVNTKSIQFSVGKGGALKLVTPTSGTSNAKGTVSFGDTDIAIASGETQVLSFHVERGAFTEAEGSAEAFDMVLTFNFN